MAVELEPGNAEARENIGLTLFNLGKYDQAIGQLELAIKNDPQREKALFVEGLAFEQLKRPAEARRALEHFVADAKDTKKYDRETAMAMKELAKLR